MPTSAILRAFFFENATSSSTKCTFFQKNTGHLNYVQSFPFFEVSVLLNAFSFWKATYIQLLSIKYRDSELCAISSFFWSKLTFKGNFLLNMQLHLRKKHLLFKKYWAFELCAVSSFFEVNALLNALFLLKRKQFHLQRNTSSFN